MTKPMNVTRRSMALASALACSSMLASCATLPSAAPTASAVLKGSGPAAPGYVVKPLDANAYAELEDRGSGRGASLNALFGPDASVRDALAPGDILDIRIYEIGVALFAGPASAGTTGASDLAAHAERFPNVVVTEEGTIVLPYLGRIAVAGGTLRDAELKLQRAMQGKSQSPQVLVSLADSARTSVTFFGDIRKPGRVPLTPFRERLLDGIAAAGGAAAPSFDEIIRVSRGTASHTIRLSDVLKDADANNIVLAPGDRVEVVRQPRTFLALGAAGRVAQVPFDADQLTLAEAIAKMSGLNENQADPRSVFLFRNESLGQGPRTIYRLDLLNPRAYLIAQNIHLQDKDLLLVSNAKANLPAKLVSVINQLFSPFVTARAISGQ